MRGWSADVILVNDESWSLRLVVTRTGEYQPLLEIGFESNIGTNSGRLNNKYRHYLRI